MGSEAMAGALLLAIAVFATGFYIGDYGGRQGISLAGATAGNDPPGGQSPNPGIMLTLQETAKHNNQTDCWIIVNGKVYDVTGFLGQHPGGTGTILPYCGAADATAAFATKGGTGNHSSYADQLLSAYYIGNLNGQVTGTPANNTVTLPPRVYGDDDDD